jgi:hypothetical protein
MKINFEISDELALIIPRSQLLVTAANPVTYAGAIEQLAEQLKNCPKLYETDAIKEHPAVFHYFYGGTDMYICEYEPETGVMFGFVILNGDLQNAEWGYTGLAQIITIPVMNIDYHFEKQSIEAALYKRYPRFFKKPRPLIFSFRYLCWICFGFIKTAKGLSISIPPVEI